jgi:hypothetical protein
MFKMINPKHQSILASIFLLGMFLGWPTSTLQAEPPLRVCKNGVIYYYFSQRGDDKIKPSLPSVTRRSLPPSVPLRVSSQEMESLIQEAAQRHNLPPSLIKAVIRVESNFHPGATSPKGAQGLMQLMPNTAAELEIVNPYDARENIGGGAKYLRFMLQRFDNCLPLALAAYNAGPRRVQQCRDVPNIRETKDYVKDVCADFLKFSQEVSHTK